MAHWTVVRRNVWRCGTRYRVRFRFRLSGGGVRLLQRTLPPGGSLDAALDAAAELRAQRKTIRKRSLTLRVMRYSTFGALIDFYSARKQPRSMLDFYRVLKRDLGAVSLGELAERFDRFLQLLRATPSEHTHRPRSEVCVNRYIDAGKMVCSYAVKMAAVTGLHENPLAGFSRAQEIGRDRVWTPEERRRVFQALTELHSYLYWPAYFCEWNPIRKSDLFTLTRDNLDRDNKRVHFYPSKTRGRINRETFLPFIDAALWSYFDSLPVDCPLLFPKLLRHRGKVVGWRPVGNILKHWARVLAETEVVGEDKRVVTAAVSDLHFHDVSKHCPITKLLEAGYTELDMKALGIQYDHDMVMRYAHREVGTVQERWQAAQTAVAGSIMPKAVTVA